MVVGGEEISMCGNVAMGKKRPSRRDLAAWILAVVRRYVEK